MRLAEVLKVAPEERAAVVRDGSHRYGSRQDRIHVARQ